jgi:hypothetical protein
MKVVQVVGCGLKGWTSGDLSLTAQLVWDPWIRTCNLRRERELFVLRASEDQSQSFHRTTDSAE